MKKFILIAILGLVSLFSQAQIATVNLLDGQTFASVTTDYNVTNTTAAYLLVNGAKHQAATQDILVQLDSLSGNHTNVAVSLWGRKFDTGAWVAIGSAVNWKGTTADTTIIISNATANRYRSYKINYVGTGTGVTKVDLQQFKLYTE